MRARQAAVLIALLATAGCGDRSPRANVDRPPSPITITASVSPNRVSVSPRSFGAGPMRLIVVNATGAAQRITLESDLAPGEGPGIRRHTDRIDPNDTATLAADVSPGRYTLGVGANGIRRATLSVGARRPSAQDELLQP